MHHSFSEDIPCRCSSLINKPAEHAAHLATNKPMNALGKEMALCPPHREHAVSLGKQE